MTRYAVFTSALLGASCLLIGCATIPDVVVPAGNGNYTVAGSSVAELSTDFRDEVKLIKIANQYCETHGREASLVSAESMDGQSGAATSGTKGVVFRCY